MGSTDNEVSSVQLQVENLRTAIREISHEISNPVGVLRMATYFLEETNPSPEKKAHYISLINDSLDKIEANLQRLKILRENPTKTISEIPYPGEPTSSSGTQTPVS
jgi:nitrogen-specific signal transduction histidine kinase